MSKFRLFAGCLVGLVLISACATTPSGIQRPPKNVSGLASGCGAAAPAVSYATAGGRGGDVRLPPNYDPNHSYPLLLSLHPFVLVPSAWETYSGLGDAAAARGFVVVSPLGSDPGPRWSVPGGGDYGVDDFDFLDALIDDTAARWCIDRGRVFAAGLSAGAAMSVGLTCVLTDRIRGIAASGGSNLTDLCPASDGAAALIMHGTDDPIAPVTGSETPTATPLGLHLSDVVASFASRNGCAVSPTVTQLTTSVTKSAYVGCDARTPLVFLEMQGAGHTWAGSGFDPLVQPFFEGIVGPTDRSISANDLALDFFESLH